MATTVFPQTDDVVTRTAWQSLHSTISHGDFQDVASNNHVERTSERLLFHRDTFGGVTSNVEVEEETTITLQAGHTYYVNGCFSLEKYAADTTDDACHTGIRIGAGLTVYFAACKSNAIGPGATDFLRIDDSTGFVDQTINGSLSGTNNVTFAEAPAFWIDMIVVADQTADLSFMYYKKDDNYATTYRLDELSYLKATVIKG
jgi:hypothetical protein